MKNSLLKLVSEYIRDINNNSLVLKKETVFKILKKIVNKKSIKPENIIDIHLEEINFEDSLLFAEVFYTFIYLADDSTFSSRKSLFLIHYIAADYDKFDLNLVQDCLLELDENMDEFYSNEIKKTFLKALSSNKKIGDDIKLWLKLK